MRVELRLELDEHEYAVSIEADQALGAHALIGAANSTMARLLNEAKS